MFALAGISYVTQRFPVSFSLSTKIAFSDQSWSLISFFKSYQKLVHLILFFFRGIMAGAGRIVTGRTGRAQGTGSCIKNLHVACMDWVKQMEHHD